MTDAAARIDHYVIYLRPSAKLNDWTKVAKVKNDVTEKLIQKLEPTERYVIGVASKNKGGESPIIETKPFILGKEIGKIPGPEVIKLFSCSTQLSTKFILLINVKMPTNVGILTFISMINTTSERLKARNFFICL